MIGPILISCTYIFLYLYLIFITFMHNLIRIFNKLYCFHLLGYDMIKSWEIFAQHKLRATRYTPSGTRKVNASHGRAARDKVSIAFNQ